MKGFYPKISRMEDSFIIAHETLQKRKEHIEMAEAKTMIKAVSMIWLWQQIAWHSL